jgi:hypothetical protein
VLHPRTCLPRNAGNRDQTMEQAMDGGAYRPASQQSWAAELKASAAPRMPVRRSRGRRRFDGGGKVAIIGFLALAACASLGAAVIGLVGLKQTAIQEQARPGIAVLPTEPLANTAEIEAMRAAEAALLRDLAALSDRVELARIELLRIEAVRAQALEAPLPIPLEPEPIGAMPAEAPPVALSSAAPVPLAALDEPEPVAALPIELAELSPLPALPEPPMIIDLLPAVAPLPDPDAPPPVLIGALRVPTALVPSRTAPRSVTEWTAPRLAAVAAPLPRVFLHHAGRPDIAAALARGVHGDAFAVAEIRAVRATPNDPAVRYFHAADRPAAEALARRLGDASGTTWRVRDFTFFRPPADPGTLEVWVPPR